VTLRAGQAPVGTTATPLSRPAPAAQEKKAAFGLARRSLLALSSMTLISSCVVADPPTYTDPTQTRPALNAFLATPPIFQVLTVQLPSTSTPTFTVPVRSEDNGERLIANFFIDYGSPTASFVGDVIVNPATFVDDSDRFITFVWQSLNSQLPGCHTMTLIVAHQSSYTRDTQTPDKNLALKDVALMTWWLNLLPDPTKETTVVGCPSQQPQVITPQ